MPATSGQPSFVVVLPPDAVGQGLAEAKAAAEAFLTSTTTFVMPVVTVDGMGVGDGRPGPVTRTLRRMYLEHLAAGGASW
ncbi:MAG: hypothetical protein HQL34_06310 [Alphaproteobacteria bacterium]|nr:hypothetical protein [Alphaproteobacteria bacterium]